jgi:hypothetical protein
MSDDAACAKERRNLALPAMVQLSDVALASEKALPDLAAANSTSNR